MRGTGIEWTDATWNPIRGCSRVSEGCRNCYAEAVANRFSGPGKPYEGVVQIDAATGKGTGKWNGQIKFVEKHLLDPLKWKPVFLKCEVCGVTRYQCLCEKFNHRPLRIFVNSMSDLFHENVTDEMLDKIFAVMALCPQHTFQVLTKRPERMLAYFHAAAYSNVQLAAMDVADRWDRQYGKRSWLPALERVAESDTHGEIVRSHIVWLLSNVWLGVSVEDQNAADKRIPLLLQTPAAVRFISAEPLLGAIDLRPSWINPTRQNDNPLGWAIVGGESGPCARPMHPDWARSLRDQCVVAGVPFFFKQWGEHAPRCAGINDSAGWDGMKMQRVGKKAAGRLLDGREWNEVPA